MPLDEERAALQEERLLAEWARMHSDNKENIPTLEDIVNEMTSAPNSVEAVSLHLAATTLESTLIYV